MPELDDRPAGAPPVGVTRRRAVFVAAGAVLVLVLAGGLTALWLVRGSDGEPDCAPLRATAFLRSDVTEEQRQAVGEAIRIAPEVASQEYESRAQAYAHFAEQFKDEPEFLRSVRPDTLPESWIFTLTCSADYRAVEARLVTLPGVDEVVCACSGRTPAGR